jgi:hypothetical protein
MGKQLFNLEGMVRDLDPSKLSNKYAYEIRNLRLTAQEDSTMLSLTSEKGNSQYNIVDKDNNTVSIQGIIVGYCVLHNYLTLFVHDETPKIPIDRIYRLEENGMTMIAKQLYYGNLLGFGDEGVNIEAIGIYESQAIQRVYWIDGVHQPRSINIAADDTTISKWNTMSVCPFDFMMEMQLTEQVTITNRQDIFGIFPAGTIQYVMSYYTKNGQASPSFYVSPIHYTTINNVAVAPDKNASGAFEIKIKANTIDLNFDYISIYSVQRTSVNGTPICKKVVDLKISDLNLEEDITYIDNGLSSKVVDYSDILYLGGSNIVPYAMSHKSNTLFFGNIKSNDFIIEQEDMDSIKSGCYLSFVLKDNDSKFDIAESTNNTFYPYKGQLQSSADVITTFKYGESYYFGLIAQNKYGQWSNVVPLSSERITQNDYVPSHEITQDNKVTYVGVRVMANFTSSIINRLVELNCKKLKLVRLEEIPQVACQGVLCPTIFSKERYTSNGLNYAQSSWYFRPIKATTKDRPYIQDNKCQYYHNMNIRFVANTDCNEIQGASDAEILYDTAAPAVLNPMDMFPDWNLLTMHSPDIEFGDESSFENIGKIRIVGTVPINYGITSMFCDLATAPHAGNNGSVDISVLSDTSYVNMSSSDNNAPVCLSRIAYIDNKYITTTNPASWSNDLYRHIIFPWHRSTSLGSQLTPTVDDEWYGKLGSKCMATLRSSLFSEYLPYSISTPANEVQITPFRCSDKLNYTVNIPKDENCPSQGNNSGVRIYHGIVDTILSGTVRNYGRANNTLNTPIELSHENGLVRMNYKSSTHGVFSILYNDNKTQLILPNTAQQNNAKANRDYNYPENFTAKVIVGTIGTNIIQPEQAVVYVVNKSFVNTQIPGGLQNNDLVLVRESGTSVNTNGGIHEIACYINPNTTSIQGYSSDDYYYLDWLDDASWIRANTNGNPLPDPNVLYKNWYYIYMYIKQSDTTLYNSFNFNTEKLGIFRFSVQVNTGGSGISTTSISDIEFIRWYDWNSSASFSEITGMTELNPDTYYKDYMYIADLVREDKPDLMTFEGTRWIVAGKACDIPTAVNKYALYGEIGDTYYQRYDCLKTYPYSSEAQNQIVDILSFMCETRVNIEGRYDQRRGSNENTIINDTNFNLLNMAYSQPDNFFAPQYLDSDMTAVTYFPNQIWWTKTKIYGNKIDQWTHIIPTSYLDMRGDLGEIEALRLWNDKLICFQDTGIAQVMYNERTAIASTQGVPIEIANSNKIEGNVYISDSVGCTNKNSIQLTQEGIYFVDSHTRELYKWSKSLESLSKSKGFNSYFYNKDVDVDSIKTFYDPKLKDVYFRINKGNITECLVYGEQLGEFTSFFDYDMDFMFQYKDSLVSVAHNSSSLWKQFANDEYLRYFGRSYIVREESTDKYEDYLIELVVNENPTDDKVFTNIEFRANVLNGSITIPSQSTDNDNYASINKLPFKTMKVWNEYQDTGTLSFQRLLRKEANLAQKFRIWRAEINRDTIDKVHKFNRIRSPWARIRLTGGGDNKKTVIHDIAVNYI